MRAEGVQPLPVLAVFGEALHLAARHSGAMLLMSLPLAGLGVALTLFWASEAREGVSLAGILGFVAVLGVYWAWFSVRVHRMILLPGSAGEAGSRVGPYLVGMLLLALLGLVPALGAVLAARAVVVWGLPEPLPSLLMALLPYLTVQAALARGQMLYLPGISVATERAWEQSARLGRGLWPSLAGACLLCSLYSLVVSLFAGWLVGQAFETGPQGILEFLTLVVGLPAQMGVTACLQAACYARLFSPPRLPEPEYSI